MALSKRNGLDRDCVARLSVSELVGALRPALVETLCQTATQRAFARVQTDPRAGRQLPRLPQTCELRLHQPLDRRRTYTPTVAAAPQFPERIVTFNVRPGVAVYGGFAGTETRRSQRDFTTHRAILSGDIGVPGSNTDNSYRVVSMYGTTTAGTITASTVLDGFTIRDGYANNNVSSINSGAGLHCLGSGSGNECSPSLRTSPSSRTAPNGGASYNHGNAGVSSPLLVNVTMSGNSAGQYDGAMFNDGGFTGDQGILRRTGRPTRVALRRVW